MPPYNADDYEPVEDRIRAFYADHPDGWISTELLDFSDKRFIVKARVGVGFVTTAGFDERLIATGLAEEIVGAGPVNRNYALENCETSAIGRALANAGYATKGKRPSREEMQKVQRVERRPMTPADEARIELRLLVHNMNLDGHKIADEYNHKYGDDLADTDSANSIRDFTEFVRKREERDADPEAAQG